MGCRYNIKLSSNSNIFASVFVFLFFLAEIHHRQLRLNYALCRDIDEAGA